MSVWSIVVCAYCWLADPLYTYMFCLLQGLIVYKGEEVVFERTLEVGAVHACICACIKRAYVRAVYINAIYIV